MKHHFLPVFVVAAILSCTDINGHLSNGKAIEGTYVLQSKGEFSLAYDTLTIKPIPKQKNLFLIERCVGYQRLAKKGKRPKELKQEKLTGIWDAEKGELKEQKHGRTYFLSGDGSQLVLGSAGYAKIEHH